jgi:SlyX protein
MLMLPRRQLVSNSRMPSHDANDAIDHRLTDLEIKASFNEDLLDQLNQVVIRQQGQIDALLREVAQLRHQMPEPGGTGFSRAGDDLPPHY